MIDKESGTIESLVSLLLTFTPDQMAAFVAGAREIITQYTPKEWPVRQPPRREEPITGRAPLAGRFSHLWDCKNGHNLGIIALKTTKNHQKIQQADMRIIAQYRTLFNDATLRISNL